MPWATVFFPSHLMQLMNLLTSVGLCRGSGLSMSSLDVNFLNAIGSSCFSVMFSPMPRAAGILRSCQLSVVRCQLSVVRCAHPSPLLAFLGPVLRAAALAAIDAQCIQRPADEVVARAGEVKGA